jgi:hypothetical protein
MFGNGNSISVQSACVNENNRQLSNSTEKAEAFVNMFESAVGRIGDTDNPFAGELKEKLSKIAPNQILNRPISASLNLNLNLKQLSSCFSSVISVQAS